MRDVADEAQVSLKTVSRVVNDESGVSAQTRQRVRKVMEALRFSPNMAAGSLRRQDRRTASLGLVVVGVDNPFDATVQRAVEETARKHSVAVFASATNEDPALERELVAHYNSRRVDALIAMPSGSDHRHFRTLISYGTPVVTVDRRAVGVAADCVLTDNFESAKLATEHLLAMGHRRVAFLNDLPTIPSAVARYEGYRAALAAAGVAADDALISTGNHTEAQSLQSTLRIITSPDPPTAVFSAQDIVTFVAVRALHERNLHHRIALVGFDDFPLADLLDPPLTVIAQDPYAIGQLAAQRAFRRLQEPDLPVEQIIVPARLIRRGSGEIAVPGLV
jgi:LacI family transcriptional regulator